MKTIYTSFLLFFSLCISSFAQTSLSIPYQAVARDNSGSPISNQLVSLRFSVLDQSFSGPVIYNETHSVTTNSLGLFTVEIGRGIASTTSGPFDPSKWKILATFIKVEMDPDGGTNYIDMGTSQILSVPFAAYSKISGSTPGSVVYKGTWDASSTSPPAASDPESKGFYYVVSVAGSTSLDGIDDWNVGDWAIYNGTVWEKVDNSESPTAADVSFEPTDSISATNVQDAIAEVDNSFYNLLDSYVHKTDDGIRIYSPPGNPRKRFGIGDSLPLAPLGILAEDVTENLIDLKSSDGGNNQNWLFGFRSINPGTNGLSLEENSGGFLYSRFFIQKSSGFVGIGTLDPKEKVHISGGMPNGGVGLKIQNTSTGTNDGWNILHADNTTNANRKDALDVEFGTGIGRTSLSLLKSGNVGINETLPMTTLHVSKPASDPTTEVSLADNTGIMVIGPIEDNHLVFDNHQIQSRIFDPFVSTTTAIPSTLDLQRLGGSILIHGTESMSNRVFISSNGSIGIGNDAPSTKLHVSKPTTDPTTVISMAENTGILCLGQIDDNNLVFDYRGIQARVFDPLVSTSAVPSALNLQRLGGSILIHGNESMSNRVIIASNGSVGIGNDAPAAKLQVSGSFIVGNDAPELSGPSRGGLITNTAAASVLSTNRIGLEISTSSTWGGSPLSKNVGLYVSNASGQSQANQNLAAILNGNVVIGDLTSSNVIGNAGSNVLAIQNGMSPASPAGNPLLHDGGIQLYSQSDVTGTSLFHLMNGDGNVVKLFKTASLTAPDQSAISSSSYGATESEVINNMRQRINELEAKLQAFGLIQ